jgi:hypothetical protein
MKRMKMPAKFQHPKYSTDEEPIVLSKPTMDILLRQDHSGDLIALYVFYYYTAKWQKTNQPKATTQYTAKGLGWTEDRVRKRKNILKQLKLIEDIEVRGKDNRIIGHFIHVNFIWSRQNFHPHDFPQSGSSHSVENSQGNALSTGNINALNTNTITVNGENLITPQYFSKFWRIYPKKADKGKAFSKWNDICSQKSWKDKRPAWKTIKLAIQRQKKSERWQNKKFIPNPTTWLNQCRWLDDPKEMVSYDSNENNTPASITQHTPDEILKSHFDSDWLLRGMKNNYKQASQLTTRGDESELANNICQLYNWIKENQDPEILGKVNDNINPPGLIKQYIIWLSDQDWINDITPQTFHFNSNLFQKMFLSMKNKELNVNVLTGKFIPSYETG